MNTSANPATPAQRMLAKLQREAEEREALKGLWNSIINPKILPEDRQFNFWLHRFGFDIVAAGLERCAVKFSKQIQEAIEQNEESLLMGMMDCILYASKAMNLIKGDLEAAKERRGASRG